MYCKYCGIENPDEAVFCKNCGKRLDGKIVCPSCGNEADAEWEFCIHCGQRIKESNQNAQVVNKDPAAKAATAKKVLNYTSAAAVLATAVFSLIFVFLIGISATIVAMDGYASASVSESHYLYYYFGGAYKELESALLEIPSYSAYFSLCMYTPTIFGTVISALTLVAVLVFSIIAIVRSILYLLGKNKNNGAKCAITAFMLYVAGAVMLYVLNNAGAVAEGAEITYSLNGATVAGIVLCSISAAAYLGCAVAVRGKELLKANTIVKIALSLAGIVLAAVILGIASKPAYGLKSAYFTAGESVNVGSMLIISMMGLMCSAEYQYNRIGNADAVYAYSFIAFFMLAALLVIGGILLVKNVEGATRSENKIGAIVLNIVLTSLAVMFLAFTVTAAKEFISAMEVMGGSDPEGATFTYGVPIAVLVLSVVSLAAKITEFCIVKHLGKKPAEVQNV